MATKKITKSPSKTAATNSKSPQNSTKPSDEQKQEASTIPETENPSSSNSNQSSQTETISPETDSSSSEDDIVTDDPELEGTDPDEEDVDQDDEDGTEDEDGEVKLLTKPDADTYRPEGAPEGRIIPIGAEVTFNADPHETYAVITEDTYQEVRLRGSRRTSYRLIYTKGTSIPQSALEKK